jgi:hypothetical protein
MLARRSGSLGLDFAEALPGSLQNGSQLHTERRGRVLYKTLLELVIGAMIRSAASGAPSMAALHKEIRANVRPQEGEKQGGCQQL